jgi:hypothetical protein
MMVTTIMFIVVKLVGSRRYMQLVESYRHNGVSRHRLLSSLGRYDEESFHKARGLVNDYGPLEHARAVIADVEETGGSLQGKGISGSFVLRRLEKGSGGCGYVGKRRVCPRHGGPSCSQATAEGMEGYPWAPVISTAIRRERSSPGGDVWGERKSTGNA